MLRPAYPSTTESPEPDKRKMQTIFLRPTLKDAIDARRGKMSRSEWIERAIKRELGRG